MESVIASVLLFVFLVWFVINREKAGKQARKDKLAAESAYKISGPSLHCMDCGEDFKPPLKGALRGNTTIEVVLWLCYIIPGAIYSIWRRSGTFKSECPSCHSNKVVPISSRAALAHIKSLS